MDRSSPGWVTDPTAPVEPGELRRIAVAVATETAALAARVRERVVDPEGGLDTKSSATDVVTEGDTACEALVRRRLAELRPGDSVLGEEGGTEEGRTGVRWVVDPIDGTVNYTRGLPWFAVSLGVEIDGVPAAGAVVEPVSGRVWSAARGLGATRDGMPLRASRLDRVDLAVIGTGLNYDPARRRRQAALVARVAGAVGDLRRTGCASLDLCAVAAGWTDGFYEHGLHAWDVAAGALVAAEAGARVVLPRDFRPRAASGAEEASGDLDGLGDDAVLAAGPALAAPLAALLRREGAGEV